MSTSQAVAVAVRPTQAISVNEKLSTMQSQQQQQSVKLCQNLISTSVGCIAFLRGLLPEDSFEDMFYGNVDPDNINKTRIGTKVKTIKRGKSKEADILQDWMEHGIFEALNKGYLRAFQLVVFLDAAHPEKIFEAYTFSVHYQTLPNGSILGVEGLTMKEVIYGGRQISEGNEVHESEARKSIQLLLRKLITMTQTMEPLPESRYLTIRLYHTKNTPTGYAPPNFGSSDTAPKYWLPNTPTTFNYGSVSTGLHVMNINVASSSLSTTASEQDPGSRSASAAALVSGSVTEVSKKRPNSDNKLVHEDKENNSRKQNDQERRLQAERQALQQMGRTTRQSSGMIQTQEITSKSSLLNNTSDLNLILPPPAIPNKASTHFGIATEIDSNIEKAAQILERMSSSSNEEHTRGTKRQRPDAVDIHSVVTRARSRKSSTRLSNTALFKCTEGTAVEPNELKLDELKNLRKQTSNVSLEEGKRDDDVIKCQCQSEKEVGDMIYCASCDTWQHLNCYGFVSQADKRLPKNHICYECLLGKTEPGVYAELCDIALKRRALIWIWKSGVPKKDKDFAIKLGCKLEQLTKIWDCFVEQGLVSRDTSWMPHPSHKKGAPKVQVSTYKCIKNEETAMIVEQKYLNPLRFIAHHYNLPESNSARILPASGFDVFEQASISSSLPFATIQFEKPRFQQSSPGLDSYDSRHSPYQQQIILGDKDNALNGPQKTPRHYPNHDIVYATPEPNFTYNTILRHSKLYPDISQNVPNPSSTTSSSASSPSNWRTSDVIEPLFSTTRL